MFGKSTGRGMSVGPLSLLLTALLLAVSCGPSAAYRRASEAEAVGDWPSAVESYRQALAEDPEDDEIRARLEHAEEAMVATSTATVAAYVAANDYQGALEVIARPLGLLPQDPRLHASLESIRVHGLAHFRQMLEWGHHRHALEGAGMLQSSFPADAEVAALVADARREYGEALRARALSAEAGGLSGLALATWATLWSLDGSDEARVRAAALRNALENEIRFTYHVRLEDHLTGAPAPTLEGRLAVLTLAVEDARTSVVAALSPARFDETSHASIEVGTYLAGYEEVPNPAYTSLQQQILYQQDDILDAERDVLRCEQRVHDAEVERDRRQGEDGYQSYYDRWDDAVRELQRSREALQRERERLQWLNQSLHSTPPTNTREIWADYPYEVVDHTLSARADLDLWVYHPDGPASEDHETLATSTSDRTHDSHPLIGLATNPLSYPVSHTGLTEALEARALERVLRALRREFERYRGGFESNGLGLRAGRPDEATDWLVRALLLQPSAVSGEVVQWLDENVGLTDVSLLVTLR